jgi:hypothetical protein
VEHVTNQIVRKVELAAKRRKDPPVSHRHA